jgi:hypothetical protein
VVSLLEGSTKVIVISGVLGTRVGLAESGVINRQKAELIPFVDVSLACTGGRFGSWTCHHFGMQFLNMPIGQELELVDDIVA